jgi:GntR family transcriptional regulator
MTAPDAQFGQYLRRLRRSRGLSFRALAQQVNYSHTYLWELETGRKQPTRHAATALDAALDADGYLAQLARDEQSPAEPLANLRRQIEAVAREASSSEAGQWAQLATWLYDTFVRHRAPFVRHVPARYATPDRAVGATPFRGEAIRQGRVPATQCRSIAHQAASPEVAARLAVAPGTSVVRRENHYRVDGEPLQSATTHVPAAIAGASPIAVDLGLGAGGIYARLEDAGHRVDRVREELQARMPTPAETADLRIPAGVPVLDIVHTSYDRHGEPFEVTCFVIRADLSTVTYETSA